MNDRDIVFIVGAGRSGTTWLHLMLGAHPEIATGQESQIFDRYLRKLDEQWNRELHYPQTDALRQHGISSYIGPEKFYGLMRDFAVGVFENVLGAKPGASMFLEKSPNNSFNVDLIIRCFPGARFVHVIRDGRDVVTSMLAARTGWGRQWAPRYAADAAAEWNRAVTECRRLATLSPNYAEVRYEDLLSHGVPELQRVLEFIDKPLSKVAAQDIYDRFSFEKLKGDEYPRDVFKNTGIATASGTVDRPEPEGFFRKGVAGDWRNQLTRTQLAETCWVAGETLAELGYIDSVAGGANLPWSIRKRRFVAAVKSRLRRLGSRLLS